MNTQQKFLALCASVLSLTCSVYAQGSLTPPGAPAPTMRTLDQLEPRMPIGTVPFVITQPGSYVVVRNLSGSAGCITVSASDVTIDLNGFTLTGDRLVLGHAVIIVPGADNVEIRNGVIQQWGDDGIHAPGVTDLQLHNVRVAQCAGDGVEVGSATIRDVTVADNAGAGLRAGSGMGAGKVSVHDISFMKAARNGGGGISFVGPCDASVCDSHVLDNTGNGVAWATSLAGDHARVCLQRCDVSGNTGRGLHIEEASAVRVVCSTRGSSFLSNGGDGIAVLLTHADAGLQLDLREGSASGNGGCGMNIQEGACNDNRNVIADFDLSLNVLDGGMKIDTIESPSFFTRVVARGNGRRGLAVEGGTWTLEDCTVADNVSHGIASVMRTSHNGHVTLIKFADCDVARNGGSGVAIAPDANGGPYKVAMQDMHVHDNGNGGITYIGTCDATVEDASVSGNTGNGLSWASAVGGGGTGGAPAIPSRCVLKSFKSIKNSASGLYVSEPGPVDLDCDFSACVFDGNGADGVTLLLTHVDARLDIVCRGGECADNAAHGLNIAAGKRSNQGFFDIALSRNGGSGLHKIDAGVEPGTMERVVAQKNALHGLDLTGGTWSIGRCTVSDNIGGGVVYASRHARLKHVSLLKVYDCTMERNGGDGLYVHTVEDDASYKVSMQDMHFRSNTGSGVRLSCDNALCSVELDALDCSASGNAACGVRLHAAVAMDKGLRFRVKGGDCDDNAQGGIFVDDSADVRSGVLIGCVLRDNGTTSSQAPGFRAPGGALRLERCVASGNSGDGFLITRPPQVGTLYQFSLSCDGCDAVRNGGSGIVVASFDASTHAPVSVVGGQVCDNTLHGIDLSTSPGARGRVHALHCGANRVHGLLSAAASLDVCDNQFTGNVGSGLHVLSGAHRVARNVCADNAVGVYLTAAGSTVLQNTFSGSAGGVPQVAVEDASGACDVAPPQNAASGTNPLGNLVF